MDIMVERLVPPGRFSRQGACFYRATSAAPGEELKASPAEPVLPPDEYHSTMVGYVTPLEFDDSELSPPTSYLTAMVDTEVSCRSMSRSHQTFAVKRTPR